MAIEQIIGPIALAATGQTGNNIHAVVDLQSYGTSPGRICLEVIVEAVGGTPTCTFRLLPSIDAVNTPPGQGLVLLQPNNTSPIPDQPVTAVGRWLFWVDQAQSRFVRAVALQTYSNTNVTYRANLYLDNVSGP